MIEQLRLKNFRRYEDETFLFEKGLNLITGRNNSGKTTLFYALEYAFFGNVSHFRSPSAFINPKERSMGVEIQFRSSDGRLFRLQRMHERPPRSKTKIVGHFTLKEIEVSPSDGTDDDDGGEITERYVLSSDFQDHEAALALKIYELLGISKRLFEISLHTRQGKCAAILSGASEFDMVLGATAAVVAGEEMRALALGYEKECAAAPVVEESIRQQRQQIQELEDQLKTLGKEERGNSNSPKAIEEKIEQSANEIKKWEDLRVLFEKLETERTSAADLTRELGEVQPSADEPGIEALEKEGSRLQAENEKLEKTLQGLDKFLAAEIQAKGDLQGRIDRRSKLKGQAQCETCGQDIDGDHAAEKAGEWCAELKQVETQLATRETEESSLRSEIKRSTDQISEHEALTKDWNARSKMAASIEEQLKLNRERQKDLEKIWEPQWNANNLDEEPDENEIADRIEEAKMNRVRLESELEHEQARKAQFEKEKNRISNQQKNLERDLSGRKKQLEGLGKKEETAKLFRQSSKAFKELQTRIREENATTLAKRTLELHGELSGNTTEFSSLSVDSQNYMVFLQPNDMKEEVPAWLYQGGGQKALLGLAYKLALAELAGSTPFLLLDEPTDGLDIQHRGSLFRALEKCPSAGQIMLITHEEWEGETSQRIVVSR